MSIIFLAATGCTPAKSYSYELTDVGFYEEALSEIESCLRAGRDCGHHVELPTFENRWEDCMSSIEAVDLDVRNTEAKLVIDCTVGGVAVRVAASGDRGTKAKKISDPVASIAAR